MNETNASEMIPTRQSLLSRLKNWNDNESWTVFFETYWRLIYNTAIKAGLSPTEAEDVVQETIISVSKRIPGFKYDRAKGTFKAWLLQLTAWRINDQFRKRQRNICRPFSAETAGTDADLFERLLDPASPSLESIWDEEWETNLQETAIERVKRKVDAKQYQAFDFYAVKNWPVERIARALNMSRGMVYVAKHRIQYLIRKEIAYLKSKPF